MSAWTITAIDGVKSTLEGDSRLSQYVDTVVISSRLRDDHVPRGMDRHAIELVPGAIVVEARTPTANTERFSVAVRLVILVWDPTDDTKVVTSNSVTGGVGASEVGMLQFVEDVANALRKVELGILEMTGVECDAMPSLAQVVNDGRDRLFYEITLTWSCQHKGYHDPALRS